MASSIDPAVPEQGNPTTLSVRGNFQAAKDEVEALQARADALEAGTSIAYATATTNGVVELATQAEVDTGTDTTRVLTPATFTSSSFVSDVNATTFADGGGMTVSGGIGSAITYTVGAGTGITVNANDVALDTTSDRNTDHSAVTLTAGTGITGGGDITASRSFAFDTTFGDARYLQSGVDLAFSDEIQMADDTAITFGAGSAPNFYDAQLYYDATSTSDLILNFRDQSPFYPTLNIKRGGTTVIELSSFGNAIFSDDVTCVDLNYSGSLNNTSDIRVKDNIKQIDGALDKLKGISGNTYTRTDLADTEEVHVGVLAQELQAVLPEGVGGTPDLLTVNPMAVIALLVEAVKELSDKVEK